MTKNLSNSPTAIMASPADIVASMRSLDLSPSPHLSNPKAELNKTNTKAANSQSKLNPQIFKTNPINVPNRPSRSQSSKSQPSKSQPKCPLAFPVYTPLRPLPKIADGGKTVQFQARAELGATPASPREIKRNPRNYTKRSNSAAIATQPVPSAAPLSSRPLSSPVQPKPQATSPLQGLTEEFPQQTFRYVVQVSGDSDSLEGIVGVYSELERANECAKGYVGRWGVGKSEIVDIQSSLGHRSKVMRRSWKNGTSEIKVDGAWVKVLPKEFTAPEEGDDKMYLAVDRSGSGLFVIGIFSKQEPAGEACEKYRDQLAYCSALEEKEQWFDGQGIFHSKGKIGGKGHHWFVVEYPLDGKVK